MPRKSASKLPPKAARKATVRKLRLFRQEHPVSAPEPPIVKEEPSLLQRGFNWLIDKGPGLLSKVFGMGTYHIKSNSLLNTGVPSFTNTQTTTVKHREFLGDITSSTTFSSTSWVINPGNPTTFPWLSQIAKNYQEYKFKGLMFEFNTTSATSIGSTNTALGTVVLSTQYNVLDPIFDDKKEMEAYEYTVSGTPAVSIIHPVECAEGMNVLQHLYVQTNSLTSADDDQRLYDLGRFQVATVGMQAASNIGELWVTYDVELFKPRLHDIFNDANLLYATQQVSGNGVTRVLSSATTTIVTNRLGITFPSSTTATFAQRGWYAAIVMHDAITLSSVNTYQAITPSASVVVYDFFVDSSAGRTDARTCTGTGNVINIQAFEVLANDTTATLGSINTHTGSVAINTFIIPIPGPTTVGSKHRLCELERIVSYMLSRSGPQILNEPKLRAYNQRILLEEHKECLSNRTAPPSPARQASTAPQEPPKSTGWFSSSSSSSSSS